RVAGVALDPVPGDLVRRHRRDEALPQVNVLDRLLGGGLPPVALPARQPLGDPVEHVLAVGVELHRYRPAERLERRDRGEQLHPVVRGRPVAAMPLRLSLPGPAESAISDRSHWRGGDMARRPDGPPIPSRFMTTWGSP